MENSNLKRIEANRRNALKSTGPRTPEGKARSSKNALSHGIFAEDLVLDQLGEDEDALLTLRETYFDFYMPIGLQEETIVDDIVTLRWRVNRLRRAETGRISIFAADHVDAGTEPGTSHLFLPNPDTDRRAGSRVLGITFTGDSKTLAQLSSYETRLTRMLERAEDRLEKLQNRRETRTKAEPKNEPISTATATKNVPRTEPAPRKTQNEPNVTVRIVPEPVRVAWEEAEPVPESTPAGEQEANKSASNAF